MRLQGGAVRRAVVSLLAMGVTSLAWSNTALAIETGAPPSLPPPPPPPLTSAPPGATPPPPPPPRPARPAPPAGPNLAVLEPMHALDTRWSVSALLGFGSEDLNFGIGVRGGKTLENHIYVGGTFVFHTGDSGQVSGTVTGPGQHTVISSSYSYNGFYIGPEGGYDFDLRYVVVRPYIGIGLFDITGSASGNGVSASSSSTQFVVWPGCTGIWNVPETNFFLGADIRLITVPGGALGVYALGGLHFGS